MITNNSHIIDIGAWFKLDIINKKFISHSGKIFDAIEEKNPKVRKAMEEGAREYIAILNGEKKVS